MGKRINDPFVLETDPLWKRSYDRDIVRTNHLRKVLKSHACWIYILYLVRYRPLLLATGHCG